MYSFFVSPGIRFNDCMFSEPVRLADWAPPGCGGIVVLLSHDRKWAPKPFRAIYFAEFGNDANRQLSTPAGSEPMFVSVLGMPFSTTAQRRALRDELVAAYNPAGQAHADATSPAGMIAQGPRRPIGFAPLPVPVTAIGS